MILFLILAGNFRFRWNPIGRTVAGVTSSSGTNATLLRNVRGLALYSGTLLNIADKDNHRVQRWSIGGSSGFTVAGQENGTSGAALNELYGPTGTALDSNGNIYVADSGNHRVVFWTIGASSGTIVAGNGKKSR